MARRLLVSIGSLWLLACKPAPTSAPVQEDGAATREADGEVEAPASFVEGRGEARERGEPQQLGGLRLWTQARAVEIADPDAPTGFEIVIEVEVDPSVETSGAYDFGAGPKPMIYAEVSALPAAGEDPSAPLLMAWGTGCGRESNDDLLAPGDYRRFVGVSERGLAPGQQARVSFGFCTLGFPDGTWAEVLLGSLDLAVDAAGEVALRLELAAEPTVTPTR
ncbi:hypothetical protein G6O69_33975 [Pseudenhygromyxa sp. WMMC2535]|uniref:hypothetical protein n=1 Tax=Pseudenhygromyxa sp. WMMC2535 TaxID=2712867 RepID=UPI001555FCC5|nr:hypothetical protein [Pseudenhygromyxa sp. WMMC2535]NVB42879.1 hypothetical protein [Pseudenhygromyxa sp. WMMC2535]